MNLCDFFPPAREMQGKSGPRNELKNPGSSEATKRSATLARTSDSAHHARWLAVTAQIVTACGRERPLAVRGGAEHTSGRLPDVTGCDCGAARARERQFVGTSGRTSSNQ